VQERISVRVVQYRTGSGSIVRGYLCCEHARTNESIVYDHSTVSRTFWLWGVFVVTLDAFGHLMFKRSSKFTLVARLSNLKDDSPDCTVLHTAQWKESSALFDVMLWVKISFASFFGVLCIYSYDSKDFGWTRPTIHDSSSTTHDPQPYEGMLQVSNCKLA
jgi:hypothetical protein